MSELGEVVGQILANNYDGYVEVGRDLGIKQYHKDKSIQVTSYGPGTDGNEEIIIYKQDYEILGKVLLSLAECLKDEDAEVVGVVDIAANEKGRGKLNGNLASRK